MNNVIRFDNVTFSYPNKAEAAIKNINFTVQKGEFVLLTGASGCGKSTVLKMLNGLIPQESGGKFSGNVYIEGQSTKAVTVADISSIVGMVFQSPEDQIFASSLFDEVAFVLENMGMSKSEIMLRVKAALQDVGLANKENCSIHELSGGQKQRLAVAAVLAAKPDILALDEPISQVDPANAEKLLNLLISLNREKNITVFLVEHRLHEVLNVCNRIMIMNEGEMVWDEKLEVTLLKPELFARYGIRIPQVIDICQRLNVELTDNPQIAAKNISLKFSKKYLKKVKNKQAPKQTSAIIANIHNLHFAYRNKIEILRGINLQIKQGDVIALMGTNGAGKSTLLQQLVGILEPDDGKIEFPLNLSNSDIGFVMQNPDFMLFNRTVKDEILFGVRQLKKNVADENELYQTFVNKLSLNDLAKEFPLSLSRGQRLRVAIAAVLSFNPKLLLLDEPTTGQDIAKIDDILTMLKEYALNGGTVVFCTHDTEIAAAFAKRVLIMQDGEIIADGNPTEIFYDEGLLKWAGIKQPPAIKVAKLLGLTGVVSVKEVILSVVSPAV